MYVSTENFTHTRLEMDQKSDPKGIEPQSNATKQVWEYERDQEEVVVEIPSKNHDDNEVDQKKIIRTPWSESSPYQPLILKPFLQRDQTCVSCSFWLKLRLKLQNQIKQIAIAVHEVGYVGGAVLRLAACHSQ